jgi:hypothetical protein
MQFSGPFEECSVRAIFALNQEKVLNDYLVTHGEVNEEEMEEIYNESCNRVVCSSVTLVSINYMFLRLLTFIH